METKKQTSVEWLTNELVKKGFPIEKYGIDLYDQAKAMEKEQIVTAYLTPLTNEYWYKDEEWLNNESEDYYNKTYNK